MTARILVALCTACLLSSASAQQAPPAPSGQGKPLMAPSNPVNPKGNTGMVPIEPPKREGEGAPPADGMIPGQGMPPSDGEATKPVIKCEPDPLDLGEMVVDTSKSGTVKLINTSDKPVTVTKAITSCGCTTAGTPKEPIPPGGSADVEISLKAGPKPGASLSKRVTFQVDGHPPTIMTVQGKVPAYVTIAPENIEAPADGKTSEGAITLKSVDGTPFRITAVAPPIVPDVSGEAKLEHVVHIDWDSWRDKGRTIKLAFSTDHPKAPAISCIIRRPAGSPSAPAGPTASDKAASELVTAARSGDVAAVRKQLDAGAKIDAPESSNGRAALHFAAKEGRTEVVALLLERNADLRVTDNIGKAPLFLAGEAGRTEVVKQLLEAAASRGVDIVNASDKGGRTPLMWTAGMGNPDSVALLIAAGARVDAVDKNGLTPLLWAAGTGDARSVKLLLDAKSDVKAVDSITGDNALMRASRNGKVGSMEELVKAGSNLSATNRQGMTAWLIAAANGRLEKLRLLQTAGCDTAARDARGWNAVDYARNRTDSHKDEVLRYLQEELKMQPASQSGTP